MAQCRVCSIAEMRPCVGFIVVRNLSPTLIHEMELRMLQIFKTQRNSLLHAALLNSMLDIPHVCALQESCGCQDISAMEKSLAGRYSQCIRYLRCSPCYLPQQCMWCEVRLLKGLKVYAFCFWNDTGVKRDISDMDDPEEDGSPTKKVMVSWNWIRFTFLEAHW